MKKFYFALMAMLVSICASAADYYLIGGFNGWALKDSKVKFSDQGDGTYVLDYAGTLTSGFKINNGSWSNDNENYGSNGSKLVFGETYTLTTGGGSKDIEINGNIVDPHIVFNPTAKTLLITGQAQEAKTSYGLWGCFTSSAWGASDMTEKDGKWVIEDLNVTYTKAEFGIKQMDASTASQTAWISADGNASIKEAGTYACKLNGSNWSLATGTWSMTFDPEAMTLVVTGEGGGDTPIDPDPDPEVNYDGWYLNVQGEFNNWNPSGVKFKEDGTAEAKGLAIGAGRFNLKIWNGSADSFWGNQDATVVSGEAVQLYENGGEMTISGAEEGDEFDVFYDAKTQMMTVTKVGGGDTPIVDNSVYAIHGSIFGNPNWETINMTKNEETGNWEISGDIVAGEFGIMKNGNWLTGGGMAITEADKAYTVDMAGGNSTNELEGQYTIIYDPTAKTITFVTVTGPIVEVVTYAIHGTITGSTDWVTSDMTEEDGLWVATLNVVPGTFGIKKMINGAQKGWYSATSAEEAEIAAVGTYQATGIGGANWTSTLEGEYKFIFDPEAETLKVDRGSGIEAIEASEAAEAVYYNLQGVRVANPVNGLYIRVAGNKASKVYLK